MGLDTIEGGSQVSFKRRPDCSMVLVLKNVTDNILLAGHKERFKECITLPNKRFKASKEIIDGPILFNGCGIWRGDDGNISTNMRQCIKLIAQPDFTPEGRKQHDDKSS